MEQPPGNSNQRPPGLRLIALKVTIEAVVQPPLVGCLVLIHAIFRDVPWYCPGHKRPVFPPPWFKNFMCEDILALLYIYKDEHKSRPGCKKIFKEPLPHLCLTFLTTSVQGAITL